MVKGKLTTMKCIVATIAAVILLTAVMGAAPAFAERPVWNVNTLVQPTSLPPGGTGKLIVNVSNLGDATAEGAGAPITIMDSLPPGLIATSISANPHYGSTEGGEVICVLSSVSCKYNGSVFPYGLIVVEVGVTVAGNAAPPQANETVVSGGGAASVNSDRPVSVNASPAGFGVEQVEVVPTNEDGSPDTQAGSHPFQLTSTLDLNTSVPSANPSMGPEPTGHAKDLHFELPPGLVGNPTAVAQCTMQQFSTRNELANGCPEDTAIGVAVTGVSAGGREGPHEQWTVPVFNLVPAVGEPARFGYEIVGIPIILDTSVRTGGDYGVTVSVNNILESVAFFYSQVTFWGVPDDPRHNTARGWNCLFGGFFGHGSCSTPHNGTRLPFLTLPTSCTGSTGMKTTVHADSWAAPGESELGEYTFQEADGSLLGLSGCNRLDFQPKITVAPDGQAGSSPSGLTVVLKVPQEGSLNPTGLQESEVKDTTVALPEGVTINPAGADGLEACSEGQVGFLPGESSPADLRFSPVVGSPFCPDTSKIGTVKVKTPLLPNALEGAVYLAAQNANPFGSLVAMYIVAEEPFSGTLVKLPGVVSLNEATGQVVATFRNTPQLPFETLELHFFGGDRAPLATPSRCGTYTTTSSITPWSGNAPAQPSSSFEVTSGPNGVPCANPLPFAPSLTAGTTSIQAGGFSPFTMTMSRDDGNQNLQAIKLKMPPGILGTLSSVKLCGEPQADQGTCPADTQIGETIVSVGLGGDPFSVKGGKVFITEGYEGAPYGLSIVNPAKAGPFDLGQVVVRARIEVDPITAALTITTDNTGPYKIPTILDGIPLQIKHVNVSINRPNFTFNPTNCSPLAITGGLSSTEGSTAALSVPFQITNCAVLAFKPKLAASTSGRTSRANGASLHVKLTYPAGPYDANIKSVKVDLPKRLPSRLTTLQQACPAKTFEANPAACPPASIVGHAHATTPVLPVALEGPAYFVSHGGEQFPDLIIVLQGYGTSVYLVGSTFINKAGITSSTFKTVPDVPVGTFELTLPQGKYSALAANGSLCTAKKLVMPTSFVGQNGASIHTTTPITPTGCAKHGKAKKPKSAGGHHKGSKHGKG
jgi:hypothetical protein